MKSLRVLFALSILAAVGVVSSPAHAEEKNVITLKPYTVYGNPQRPSVVVEVSRARMQLGATTPTLAAASKIQDASKKDPF